VAVLELGPPTGPVLEREIASQQHICRQPTLRDPYEAGLVEVRGEGRQA
jgi:hypothetical protein